MNMQNFHAPTDDPTLTSLIHSLSNASSFIILNYWASWASPCAQMNDMFMELAKLHPNLHFIQIEAENFPDSTEKFNVTSVPTFLFLKSDGQVVHRLTGANPMELSTLVEHYSKLTNEDLLKFASHLHPSLMVSSTPTTVPNTSSSSTYPTAAEDTDVAIPSDLKHLIATEPILVFMKGHPDQPKCGFSNQLVQLLKKYNAVFKSIDVLENETVRQGMKTYSNWPTFPQLYVQGEFIGGVDIVKELDESGDLKSILAVDDQSLTTRLRKLIHQSPVMIFIKGSPSMPKCGFSNQLVSILDHLHVKYDYFDILTDETVRQGLKTYSNWPTYPQVYVEGELVGGLDIIKEMLQVNEFQTLVQPYIVQSQ